MKLALLILFLVDLDQNSLVDEVSRSGRCANVAETPDARVSNQARIAPGPPPLLSFRSYEGKLHGRFGNTDLMLDDAGH